MMVWMLEGSGCEAHHSLILATHTHTHTTALPPSLSFTHSHCAMHSSILLYLGQRRRLGRHTKANWNAPVSAFLTWCMAHKMQLGPAATLASVPKHTDPPRSMNTKVSMVQQKPQYFLLLMDLLHSIRTFCFLVWMWKRSWMLRS